MMVDSSSGRSDWEIVEDCLNGNVEAFATIVDRYQKPLYNVALRMTGNRDDAEDLTQAAFLKIFENLSTYRRDRKFFSWSYRIAINEVISHLKRKKKTVPVNENLLITESTPEDELCADELGAEISNALSHIEFNQRVVVVLRHFMDLSYREISDTIGIPEKTVKSRLFSARKKLAEVLISRGVSGHD